MNNNFNVVCPLNNISVVFRAFSPAPLAATCNVRLAGRLIPPHPKTPTLQEHSSRPTSCRFRCAQVEVARASVPSPDLSTSPAIPSRRTSTPQQNHTPPTQPKPQRGACQETREQWLELDHTLPKAQRRAAHRLFEYLQAEGYRSSPPDQSPTLIDTKTRFCWNVTTVLSVLIE